MCGILASLGGDPAGARSFLDRGLRLLGHRGPDDDGTYVDRDVVMGHRRLSILDLTSAGHQPMTSPDGRWTLSYNGEIYNHEELRGSLAGRWDFRSRNDAETLLALLALEGAGAIERLVGMWAFVAWDAMERQLLASRDRYGQKPLYWRRFPDGALRLSSEVAPLIGPDERPDADPLMVAEFLATGNYGHLPGRSFFKDIAPFPAAHWGTLRGGDTSIHCRRYWRFPAVRLSDRQPYDETVRRMFRERLETAVRSQCMSDVPIGATLSGGLDSSVIVGILASERKDPLPVFTAQAEGGEHDESAYVRAVEERWKGRIALRWVDLRSLRLSERTADAIRVQEEPFGDPSIIAHGLLMDAAREAGVPVILGGQGGDELLMGYSWMADVLVASAMREGSVAWAVSEARSLRPSVRRLCRVALAAAAPHTERVLRHVARRRRRSWLAPFLSVVRSPPSDELAASSDRAAAWIEAVERTALPHLTHYDDRSGMSRSLEGRMPFLDHRLADVVAPLAPDAFLHKGALKRILRDACHDLLPAQVAQRTDKIGFYTPLVPMLRAEQDWVRRLLTDDVSRSLGVWSPEVVSRMLPRLAAGSGSAGAAHVLWRLLAFRLWAEIFRVRPLTSPAAAHPPLCR